MSLKSRIPRDNHHIFMNTDHFAEEHTWNGVPFVCVPDDTEALKRKNNNVNDVGWQEDVVDKVIFVPEDSLPARAQPNEQVIFDGVMMRVAYIVDAIDMKEIHLSTIFARGVAVV